MDSCGVARWAENQGEKSAGVDVDNSDKRIIVTFPEDQDTSMGMAGCERKFWV